MQQAIKAHTNFYPKENMGTNDKLHHGALLKQPSHKAPNVFG